MLNSTQVREFREVGSVSGTVQWETIPGTTREEPISYIPSNNVQGFGLLNERKVVFTADDFSIRAGHADGALMEKTIYMEKLAIALKLPIVKLVDGSSGGGRYVPFCLYFRGYLGTEDLGRLCGSSASLFMKLYS
jgi:acetyl-CoA carboxylase carboxyltransferase component